jgi:hypothetical protein
MSIFTLGNSINFYMAQTNSNVLYTSLDNGASWVHITPQGPSPVPSSIHTAADGHTVIGVYVNNQDNPIVRSTDGGKTWSATPAFPKNSPQVGSVYTTSDGSIFTALVPLRVPGVLYDIYQLAPGNSNWTLVAQLINEGTAFFGVSGESNGHPTLVWAIDNTRSPPPILEYHPIR